MKRIDIKAGKIYGNGSVTKPLHRLVTGVTEQRVYFTVVHSTVKTGVNAVGTKDWCLISNFQKWVKEEVTPVDR